MTDRLPGPVLCRAVKVNPSAHMPKICGNIAKWRIGTLILCGKHAAIEALAVMADRKDAVEIPPPPRRIGDHVTIEEDRNDGSE